MSANRDKLLADTARALIAAFPDRASEMLADIEEALQPPTYPFEWAESVLAMCGATNHHLMQIRDVLSVDPWAWGLNGSDLAVERSPTFRVEPTKALAVTRVILNMPGVISVPDRQLNIEIVEPGLLSERFSPVPLVVFPSQTLVVRGYANEQELRRFRAHLSGAMIKWREG